MGERPKRAGWATSAATPCCNSSARASAPPSSPTPRSSRSTASPRKRAASHAVWRLEEEAAAELDGEGGGTARVRQKEIGLPL
jgi:hypothetical protein